MSKVTTPAPASDTDTVTHLARRVLAFIKRTAESNGAHRITSWKKCHQEIGNAASVAKFDEAWFLLERRGYIHWHSGRDYDHNYMLTARGQETKFDQGVIDEPHEMIAAVEKAIGIPLDEVIRENFEEAIAAFNDERMISAAITLGIVGERCARLLGKTIAPLVNSGRKFTDRMSADDLIELCTEALEQLAKSTQRDEYHELHVAFGVLGHTYRLTRNHYSHPKKAHAPHPDEIAILLNSLRRVYIPALYRVLASP